MRSVYFWPGDGVSLGHIIAGLNVQSQRGVPLMDAGPRWSFHAAANVVVTSGGCSTLLSYRVGPGTYRGNICNIVDDLSAGATLERKAEPPRKKGFQSVHWLALGRLGDGDAERP